MDYPKGSTGRASTILPPMNPCQAPKYDAYAKFPQLLRNIFDQGDSKEDKIAYYTSLVRSSGNSEIVQSYFPLLCRVSAGSGGEQEARRSTMGQLNGSRGGNTSMVGMEVSRRESYGSSSSSSSTYTSKNNNMYSQDNGNSNRGSFDNGNKNYNGSRGDNHYQNGNTNNNSNSDRRHSYSGSNDIHHLSGKGHSYQFEAAESERPMSKKNSGNGNGNYSNGNGNGNDNGNGNSSVRSGKWNADRDFLNSRKVDNNRSNTHQFLGDASESRRTSTGSYNQGSGRGRDSGSGKDRDNGRITRRY